MSARTECITNAAVIAAEAYSVLYLWPLDSAAERSRRPHESHEDARLRIEARRSLRRNPGRAVA
jgi:hypothetical protein